MPFVWIFIGIFGCLGSLQRYSRWITLNIFYKQMESIFHFLCGFFAWESTKFRTISTVTRPLIYSVPMEPSERLKFLAQFHWLIFTANFSRPLPRSTMPEKVSVPVRCETLTPRWLRRNAIFIYGEKASHSIPFPNRELPHKNFSKMAATNFWGVLFSFNCTIEKRSQRNS